MFLVESTCTNVNSFRGISERLPVISVRGENERFEKGHNLFFRRKSR